MATYFHKDLISYWALDEANGNAVDSWRNNNLTETSGTIASTTGKVGNARDFELGDTEYFTIDDNSDLSTGNIDFSFSCWVNAESLSADASILSKWITSGNQREYELRYVNSSSRFVFAVSSDGTSGNEVTVTANVLGAPSTSTWYHIICYHDSVNNLIGIKINNGTADTTSHSGGVFDSTAGFSIGSRPTPDNHFDGLIDEVGFWKRVLTTEEITYLYNSGNGRSFTELVPFSRRLMEISSLMWTYPGIDLKRNLVSYWPLDESSFGDAIDVHGSSDLTESGTVISSVGKVGNAADMAGNNSNYLSVSDNADLSFGDESFTIAFWLWIDAVNDRELIQKKSSPGGSSAGYHAGLYNVSGNKIYWGVAQGGDTAEAVSGNLSFSTWYFVVLYHDALTNKLGVSINGASANETSYAFGCANESNSFILGRGHDGLIDEVGVWRRILTSNEISYLYNGGLGKSYTDFETSSSRDTKVNFLHKLISFWKMDEASGNAIDSYGGNNLTETSGTIGSSTGKVGNARDFENGDTEGFLIADNTSLSAGDIDFTFSCWVYLESTSGTLVILQKGEGGTLEYSLYVVNGLVRWEVFDVSINQQRVEHTNVLSTGTWYNIVVWHDSVNNLTGISVNNGVPVTGSWSNGVNDSTGNFVIGNRSSLDIGFDGLIDEVGFWKRVLTDAERSALYNYGNGVEFLPDSRALLDTNVNIVKNLISYWPLNETTGNALDSHSNNNLTETSGTIVSAVGKLGNARDFESGDTEYFTIPDNSDLSTGNIDFSFSCWVNAESLSSDSSIISKWRTSGNQREYELRYVNSSSRFVFAVSSDGTSGNEVTVVASTLGTPSTSTWYNIVCWHDASANTINIKVNNGTTDTTSHSGGVFDSTANFSIGSREAPDNYWDGLIDEVGFWKRILTTEEITYLYNSGNGRSYNDMIPFGRRLDELSLATWEYSTRTLSGSSSSVSKAIQYIWNILSQISKNNQDIWNVYSSVSKASQEIWDVKSSVGKSDQFLWDLIGRVGNDKQYLWNDLAQISKSSEEIWNVYSSVSKSSQEIWDIYSSVNKNSQEVWNVLASISKSPQLIWDVRAQVSKSPEFIWDVYSTTSVAQQVQVLWNVYFAVVKPSEHIWNVRASVAKSSEEIWNVLAAINKDSSLLWDAKALIERSRQFLWNTLSISSVEQIAQIIWNVQQLANSSSDIRWNDLSIVSKNSQEIWNIYSSVNLSFEQKWNLLANVSKNSQEVWNVLSQINSSKQSLWNIYTYVSKPSQNIWDVRGLADKNNQYIWNLAAQSGNSRSLLWDDRLSIAKSDQFLWNDYVYVSVARQELWNVLKSVGVSDQLIWRTLADTRILQVYELLFRISKRVNLDARTRRIKRI